MRRRLVVGCAVLRPVCLLACPNQNLLCLGALRLAGDDKVVRDLIEDHFCLCQVEIRRREGDAGRGKLSKFFDEFFYKREKDFGLSGDDHTT